MSFFLTFLAVTLGTILGSLILDNLPMNLRRWRKPKLKIPVLTKKAKEAAKQAVRQVEEFVRQQNDTYRDWLYGRKQAGEDDE